MRGHICQPLAVEQGTEAAQTQHVNSLPCDSVSQDERTQMLEAFSTDLVEGGRHHLTGFTVCKFCEVLLVTCAVPRIAEGKGQTLPSSGRMVTSFCRLLALLFAISGKWH